MLALALSACGGRAAVPADTAVPSTKVPPPVALPGVLVLESWGVPAEDTVVTFSAMEPRVILLRRGAPDNTVFAELRIPPGVLVPPPGRATATLTLRPRLGAYGLDLEMEQGSRMHAGAQLTFSYGVHFVMPQGARERYGSPINFERGLYVAQVGGDDLVTFLASQRLASDHLTAMLTGPGRYVVAAPR